MAVPLRKVIRVRPVGGMHTLDPAQDVPEGASPDMLNFQVYNGYIRKRPGYGRYQTGSSFPASPITGIYSAQAQSGSRALYAINTTGVYKYNVATTNWDAQTGPALTGNASQRFTFDISQNALVFCQGVDNIMSLPLTGTVYAVINANAKPSKYLSRWNLRLYAANTFEGGLQDSFRVRWPIDGDHTDWVSAGSGFVDLTDDVYQIKNIKKLIDVLCVYTEKGIFVATKTGASTGPAQFALQVKDVGLFCSNTLLTYNTLHFLVGTDNFYIFNGTQFSPILTSVRNTIYGEMNPSNTDAAFAALFYDTQEYAAFIPVGSATVPNKAWVYNWVRGVGYPWQFSLSEFTCATLHYIDSSIKISDLVGTIAAQTWVIGANTLTANFPLPIFGDNDGHVHVMTPGILSDDGAAITCRWTSKDYTSEDIDPSLSGLMITMNKITFAYVDPGTAFTLQFYFSTNFGASWSGPYPVTMGGHNVGGVGDMVLNQQVTGKRIRFKIENITTNENPQIQEFAPELELRKQSLN